MPPAFDAPDAAPPDVLLDVLISEVGPRDGLQSVRAVMATPHKLEGFDLDGYAFAPASSEPERLVFRRKTPPTA